MTEITAPILSGSQPQRRSLLDWLSVSRKTGSDAEIKELRSAVKALVRDHFGYSDTKPMRSAGNFGEGEKFDRVGAEIRWTTRTQAQLNDWDEDGRCVGWVNVTFRGSTGIGRLPADQAVSLVSCLADLGFNACRRVDCTIDVFDDQDLSIFLVREHLVRGSWRIPRRDPECFRYVGALLLNTRKPKPASLYLSSKSASTEVTVYDKGAQTESERPWIRFELRAKADAAQDLFFALQQASDAASETGAALMLVDGVITSAVRSAADIRDVTGFPDYPKLPRNWMRSPKAKLPAELAPVFQQCAPLDIASLRVRGGFAAQVRHAIKSNGKCVWKLCVLSVAKGESPGLLGFELGFSHHSRITGDDFMEMAQESGLSIQQLEAAELKAITEFAQLKGYDVTCISSDRTELRAEALKGLVKPV